MSTYAGAVMVLQPPIFQDRDYENGFNDPGTISDVVTTQTGPTTEVPTYALVVLYRDTDFVAVRKTMSDPETGAYTFRNIDKGVTYTPVAYHPTKAYRAVLADGIVPT